MPHKHSVDAHVFLAGRDVGVLSTKSRNGHVYGATVYYITGPNSYVYFLTKSDTKKAHNILANPQVALTVFDAIELKTLQLQGTAHIETDLKIRQKVFDKMVRPRVYRGIKRMPPVTDLHSGGFIAFRIEPDTITYTNYNDDSALNPIHEFSQTDS